MQWLASISVKRPVFATVLVLVFVVVGMLGYTRLEVDRFPKVDFPTVMVTTYLDGATPGEIETDVTDKIEEAVNTVSGIDELHSTSAEGLSQVLISFLLEKDADVAAQEVRDRVNRILNELPDDAEPPRVEKLDPDATPVLNIALVADKPVREITEYADKVLRRQLESVAGVGQVTLLGGQKRQINVHLDPVRLRALNLTAVDVQSALRRQHVQIPAGVVKGSATESNLRVIGKLDTIAGLERLVVRENEGGLVRLGDVARVEDGAEEQESIARHNGVPTVLLSIRRQSGENTIKVVDAVKERLVEAEKRLPAGYKVDIVRDNSLVIRTSAHAVQEHLILGAVFAALIVLFFLGNSRATLISALAIPTSIIASFGVMWAADVTLNQISLVALALAVGIVIDDAIIVVENIFRHIEEKKQDPYTAAVEGTKDIGLAVMATTLSLLAVFVPVAFLSGIVGRFLASFGLTMSFAIAVSLLVSFTLAPMLSARMLKVTRPNWLERGMAKLVNIFYKPIEVIYMVMLRFSMRHRWVVVLTCVGVLYSTGFLMQKVQKGLLPETEEAQFQMSFRTPEGTSLAATDLAAERVARDIRNMPGVEYTLVTIGDNDQRTQNLASVYVRLTDPALRKETQSQIMDQVRQQVVAKYPSDWRMTVMLVPAFDSGQSSANVQYMIAGPDLDRISAAAKAAMEEARKIPGIRDLDTTLVDGKPEITAVVDRSKAGEMGVNIADLSSTLRLLVGGVDVSTYTDRGEQYDIHVRADERYRNNEEALAALFVPSAKSGPVALKNVVKLEEGDGPAQIKRTGRRRQVTITANNAPGVGEAEILAAIDAAVKKQNLPAEYDTGPVGRSKELRRTLIAFVTAFGLAFIFMYLVLAAQFESWIHPFTILLALPLTLPFALLSLLLFGESLNIFSILGLLVLFGMVKKNGILQIDHTNQLREKGMGRLEAILQANKDRLRPILMTTIAFVAGMLPLLFARGIGASMNTATAGIIIGGQTFSLLLTLLAIPVFYSLFDDVVAWRRRRAEKRVARRAEVESKEAGEAITLQPDAA
ncbi:CzcA family heavy metal efflux pump/hydrophobe/amphiphile efflux-1 (HAE1) family protein [Roseimicrobium gellanilyticum]|uniref:CzcA family heavy metal efflux pump/hydrophobe/amphiphile efflux-1 (HAE1) family protein n=1 Tax=Roseimicrobium gellanilyticum TaxID=748857 RepID=A0A366HQ31_9BACT|nr:efflux RND transporter permease subunit [Roseimicrobium gellanilyticum]RBP44294.1 CzcA family heavy metal efflux pump/hydrophobe/amphiphile efflux-1 (HAE1) family protein [Roseimicrobium gellanilyticum]